METKPFWASRTLWVNALAFAAATTGAVGVDLGLTPEVQASIVTGVMAVVNIILRFVTTTGVSAKKETPDA